MEIGNSGPGGELMDDSQTGGKGCIITQHVVDMPQMTAVTSSDCIGKLLAITVSIARRGPSPIVWSGAICSSRVSFQSSSLDETHG